MSGGAEVRAVAVIPTPNIIVRAGGVWPPAAPPPAEINTACQDCGEDCPVWEIVRTDWPGLVYEVWCYCRRCRIETFHPYLDLSLCPARPGARVEAV